MCSAGDDVHCREVASGVLELERASNSGAVVVLGNTAQCNKRVRIGPDPAPTIEADHTLQLDDRLALDRIAVDLLSRSSRSRQRLSSRSLATASRYAAFKGNPRFLGLAAASANS
jgi:hypothetical protein